MSPTTEMYTPYCIPLNRSTLIFFPSCPSSALPVVASSAKVHDMGPKDNLDAPRGDSKNEAYVVQVTIKQAHEDVIKELSTFFLAQYDITKAVESVLFAHIFAIVPPEICIEGDGYTLRGSKHTDNYLLHIRKGKLVNIAHGPIERKIWVYGQNLKLRWGEDHVRPCQDKWMFVFELAKPDSGKTCSLNAA